MGDYDANDLDWTYDGDYTIGIDGDLGDTRDDLLRSLENEIQTIVKSEFDDWEKHPILGANLSEFRGEPNSRDTGQSIEERVISRITAQGIVDPGDISVRVVPVGAHEILIIVSISAAATPGNRLDPGQPLAVNLVYNSVEDSIFFLDRSKTEREAFFD